MEPILHWKTQIDPVYLGLWNDLIKVIVVFLTITLGHLLLRGGTLEAWFETLGLELVLFSLLGISIYHLWIRLLIRVE